MPEVFEPATFSKHATLPVSPFIRAIHPKSAIPPERAAIKKLLDAGWWGQVKINGHRTQVHIPCDSSLPLFAYTRQGTLHKKKFSPLMAKDLRRLFTPQTGWTVIDAEWHKSTERLYVFDMLRFNGKPLDSYTYKERYDLLPRVYASETIETLPLLKTAEQCMDLLSSRDERIEGLVFKFPSTEGFDDTLIIRCHSEHIV